MAGPAQPCHRRGRPAHHWDREARSPAHRQSAARPLRPQRRSGLLAFFPFAGGPTAADLRRRAGQRHHAAPGMPEGEPIEHGLVTRSIESAQRKVEAHNFDIRKQLLEYDNVANDQRREIYQLRNSILESQDVSDQIAALREGVVTDFLRTHVPEESMEEQWDIPGLEKVYAAELRLELPLSKWLESDPGMDDDALLKRAIDEAHAAYRRRSEEHTSELQSRLHLVCRLLLEKKKKNIHKYKPPDYVDDIR